MLKRNITIFIILAILIVFPLISYYYLSEGTNYRKTALTELKDSIKINQFSLTTSNSIILNNDSLLNKVVLFSLVNHYNESEKSNLENLFNKFKDRSDFCLVSIQNESNNLNIKSEPNGANFYSILKSETEIDSLSNVWVKTKSPAIFVVDIKNNIRKTYKDHSLESFKNVLKHIAILLPMSPAPKATLNRDKEK